MAAALIALCGCVPTRTRPAGGSAGGSAADRGLDVPLVDERFDGPAFDTGVIRDRCTVAAPWGGRSWGIEGATFSRPWAPSLGAARFSATGRDAYVWGRDDSGEWGFVRFVQGSAWAESNCGPAPWRRFRPFDTFGRRLDLDLEVRRESSTLLHASRGWLLFAVNVWLASPNLPLSGGSHWGRKPIVMDLAVHHETTSPAARLRHFEDAWAYHYQEQVGEAPRGEWRRHRIPLHDHVRAAVTQFGFPPVVERTLQMTQIEFVIELHHSEGAARIADFTLRAR